MSRHRFAVRTRFLIFTLALATLCAAPARADHNSIGGLGRAYELFGDQLSALLDELNVRLAA